MRRATLSPTAGTAIAWKTPTFANLESRGRAPERFGLAWLVSRFAAISPPAAAGIGAAIVILVGLPLAIGLNIWTDEAFTLHTTAMGPLRALGGAIGFEAQPPLYFVLESIWRLPDEASIAFARILSILFAAAAVGVIVLAAHRIVPRVPPLAVAALAAFHPLIIWAAVELRVYPLALLIGAGLTWAFYESFLARSAARSAPIWYVVLGVAGLYTQYYTGFVLLAHGLTVVIVERRALKRFLVCATLITIGFAPFFGVALMHARSSGQFVLSVTALQAVRHIADTIFCLLLPHELSWRGGWKIAGCALAGALVIGLAVLGRPQRPRGSEVGFCVQWALSLTFFALVFYAVGVPLEPLKYLIVVAPGTLFIGLLFLSSLQHRPALAGAAAAAVYAVFTGGMLWMDYRPPLSKPGDWQRVASTVAADARSTPVAVFPAELREPLSWYLSTGIVEIPKPMPFTLDYVRAMALSSDAQVATTLDPLVAPTGRLWVVTTDDCREPKGNYYNYHCEYLESYLNQSYRVIRSVAFRGALARLYVRSRAISADLRVKNNAN